MTTPTVQIHIDPADPADVRVLFFPDPAWWRFKGASKGELRKEIQGIVDELKREDGLFTPERQARLRVRVLWTLLYWVTHKGLEIP